MTKLWTFPRGKRAEFARWIVRFRVWCPSLYVSTPWFSVDCLTRCVARRGSRVSWWAKFADPPLSFRESLKHTWRRGDVWPKRRPRNAPEPVRHDEHVGLNPTTHIEVDEYGDPAYIRWQARDGRVRRIRLFGKSPGAC